MEGRGKIQGCRGYFQGGGSGDTTFWEGDVGDDPPYGQDPGGGGVPTQVSSTDQWEVEPEVIGQELIIYTAVYGNAGIGV